MCLRIATKIICVERASENYNMYIFLTFYRDKLDGNRRGIDDARKDQLVNIHRYLTQTDTSNSVDWLLMENQQEHRCLHPVLHYTTIRNFYKLTRAEKTLSSY